MNMADMTPEQLEVLMHCLTTDEVKRTFNNEQNKQRLVLLVAVQLELLKREDNNNE